ncbi:hypothetical protein Tco_1137242 [Tanacetum coccineum]
MCLNKRFNTGRPVRSTVNTVRERGINAVKPSSCWVWRPIKPNGTSLSKSQLNDKGFVDSGCSRHMTGNIAHLSDFKDFDGGAYGGRITGKGIQGVSECVADAQIQDKDRLQDENDATKKSHEDSSLEDNATADQQVNTARPEVNTGSRDVSTAVPEVNTATPEDLEEPKRVSKALSDPAWVEAMQEELLQFNDRLWIHV